MKKEQAFKSEIQHDVLAKVTKEIKKWRLISLFKISLILKPVDLRPGVFPYDVSLFILEWPWGHYYNVSLMNPHSLLLWAGDPAHANSTVHALQSYPACSQHGGYSSQYFIPVFTRCSDTNYFRCTGLCSIACSTLSFSAVIISQINSSFSFM